MVESVWPRIKRDPLLLVCGLLLVIVMLAGLFAPYITWHDPLLTAVRQKYQGISLDYPLGTDNLGRCVFSRLVYGVRTTVFYSLLAMFGTVSLGVLVGMVAGYCGGRTDAWLMRACDTLLAFPAEVMILALAGIVGPGLDTILLAVIVVKWAWYARMIRAMAVRQRHRHYVDYARLIGAPSRHIIIRHLFAVVAAELAILASADVGSVMLLISGLSFLGLGAQPPQPEWGNMLSDAKQVMLVHPEQMLPAGMAIAVVVAAFNIVGDALRDGLDPASQTSLHQQVEESGDGGAAASEAAMKRGVDATATER
ncbi:MULTISPECIES: nickel/cobalt ABC transporter permease [Dickeya]|uniref:Nickel transport system permease protein NikC (TC 3.A.1.5.3) n=2 Tax=Pectobacteriaceae TaxID=1903410 RepID=A0A375A931_9GAMM|nr:MULTISPECIES: nickel/cobalt ABC transporter permease [Dickeya]SLM62550.1 Nickel transport system permease protein NikC (TC 3.A.1.5.3) [Dickeya aquatica]